MHNKFLKKLAHMDEFLTCTMGALYVSSACFMMLANVMRYA